MFVDQQIIVKSFFFEGGFQNSKGNMSSDSVFSYECLRDLS